jgi:hypothetical protein
MMRVYLVLDEFPYGNILRGIYTNEKDAIKVRRNLGQAYLKYATKQLKKANDRHTNENERRKKSGRKLIEKQHWMDYTPEKYVYEYIVKIRGFEVDHPLDYILYME